jgi:hypothetical protein
MKSTITSTHKIILTSELTYAKHSACTEKKPIQNSDCQTLNLESNNFKFRNKTNLNSRNLLKNKMKLQNIKRIKFNNLKTEMDLLKILILELVTFPKIRTNCKDRLKNQLQRRNQT